MAAAVIAAAFFVGVLLCTLAGPAASLPRSEVPTTILVEPGEGIRPEQARAPAFLLDKDDQLLVIDQLRGFLIGRFQPPLGLAPESDAFPGGVGLEPESLEGPPLPPAPVSPIPLQPGYPFLSAGSIAGTPCVCDLDFDGKSEVIVATTEGVVYVLDYHGNLRPGWPLRINDGFYAPPSAADINGEGSAEIVLPGVSGRVYAWQADGSLLPGWPVRPVVPEAGEPEVSFFGGASLADLSGDGIADVCVATSLGSVWAIRGDGQVLPGWPQTMLAGNRPPNPAGVFASPALADLDGDGRREVVVANNAYQIHAWHADGTAVTGWPAQIPHRARAGFSGVSVADVDGDEAIEIVVTSEHGELGPAGVSVFSADGRIEEGWPFDLGEIANAQAALGDLTGDGVPEIVVATIGGNARLIALDGSTAAPLPGWPLRIKRETVNASPVISDIDGDGRNDIVIAALSTGSESDAWIWGLDAEGNQLNGFPIMLPQDEVLAASPSCGDLDGDGDLELVAATERLNSLYAWDLNAFCDLYLCPWSSEAGGPARTGVIQLLRNPNGPRLPGTMPTDLFGPNGPDGALIGGSSIDPFVNADAEQRPLPGSMQARVVFDLGEKTAVDLVIFNIRHQPVRHLLQHVLPAGHYEIHWDGRNDQEQREPTGIYFYQLDLGGRRRTEQLLLLQ